MNKINIVEMVIEHGGSMANAAKSLGVSRQRVSKMVKDAGLNKLDFKQYKPRSKRTILREDETKTEAKAKKTANGYALLCGANKKPSEAYAQQKNNAKKRGVEFKLTFSEWWGMWKEKYAERGRHSQSFVMCRHFDKGAYEIGNVRIDTATSNHHDRIGRLDDAQNSACTVHINSV